jgi:hypothetical protein
VVVSQQILECLVLVVVEHQLLLRVRFNLGWYCLHRARSVLNLNRDSRVLLLVIYLNDVLHIKY